MISAAQSSVWKQFWNIISISCWQESLLLHPLASYLSIMLEFKDDLRGDPLYDASEKGLKLHSE